MHVSRPALHYYGTKWQLAPWIISHFPPHTNYLEPCGGAAAVLLQKDPSAMETYNDLDQHVVNFFQIVRDRPDDLHRVLDLTLFARQEYEIAKTPSEDPLEDARRFFVGCWQSISHVPFKAASGWCSHSSREQPYTLNSAQYTNAITGITTIADRLRYVQIECRPYDYLLERYTNETSLVYFDPPYVQETRITNKVYAYEWDSAQHRASAELLREVPGDVVISGYACPLYTELYEDHGWVRSDRMSQTNGGDRVESLWLAPRTAKKLHHPTQCELFS